GHSAAGGSTGGRSISAGAANLQNHAAREHFVFNYHRGDQFDSILSGLRAASAAGDRALAYAHVSGGDRVCDFILEPGGEGAAGVASHGGAGECDIAFAAG